MGNQDRKTPEIPLIIKVIAGVVIFLLLIPLLIFTALPNMFFGCGSSETETITHMTEQAMTIGGIYTSLEDFDGTQVDSIVTSIAADYEENGTAIDKIEVTSDFEEEDLLWLIAINSVAHQQDLDAMSAEDVRSFCTAHLILTPSLDFLTGEGDAVTTILKIKVQKPDPNQLMNRLGFDEQARTWAGAMFEVMRDSDALNKYSSYFEDYRPSYEGDTSFEGGPGDIEHGGSYESGIDTSGFVSPGTKNNLDLVAYAIQAWENNWGYVWGTYGNVLTESLFAYKLKQYPDGGLYRPHQGLWLAGRLQRGHSLRNQRNAGLWGQSDVSVRRGERLDGHHAGDQGPGGLETRPYRRLYRRRLCYRSHGHQIRRGQDRGGGPGLAGLV